MLKKEKLNRNIITTLYGSMLLIVLISLTASITSFGLVVYISVLLQGMIIILIPIAIIFCGYKMLKEKSKMNILYFALSIFSLTWFIIVFLALGSVLEQF